MQKKSNIAQRWILLCPFSSMNHVFENWPTSESLSKDVVFKVKSERWEGASYAKLQEKEHYRSGSKGKLIQRLVLGKCLPCHHIILNTFLNYQFPLPWSQHTTVRWGNCYQEKHRSGDFWFSSLGILSASGLLISLSTAQLPMWIWRLLTWC